MKDFINLVYIEKGLTYHGEIDREKFLKLMQQIVNCYPDWNVNSTKLCELIPTAETIRINKDFIDTQDVPIIEYKSFKDSSFNMFRLSRPCRIIWEILDFYCEQAKN